MTLPSSNQSREELSSQGLITEKDFTANNLLKPFIIDLIMNNETYKEELYKLMESPEWGEALFGDWIKDKVELLKQANKKYREANRL